MSGSFTPKKILSPKIMEKTSKTDVHREPKKDKTKSIAMLYSLCVYLQSLLSALIVQWGVIDVKPHYENWCSISCTREIDHRLESCLYSNSIVLYLFF